MNVIDLPVAPLTRKILLAQYGPQEPIHLGARNLLYRQMCYRVDETPWLKRHQQILTTTVRISVHRHLWEKVRQEPHQVGYHLYELHKDRMFTWVAGRVADGGEQLAAIREYLDEHGIEEDEFALETSYRLWKRFKKTRLKNTPANVPLFSTEFQLSLTLEQAKTIAEKFDCLSQVWCHDVHTQSQWTLRPYILYRYTRLTLEQAALELRREFQSVHRSVQRAEIALKNYPRLTQLLQYCLMTVENDAIP